VSNYSTHIITVYRQALFETLFQYDEYWMQ